MTEFKAAVPVLPVSDCKRLAAFYAENLEMSNLHQEEAYAVLGRDRVEIHLWAATDESWQTRPPGKPVESGAESFLAGTASCRVFVADIDALYARCSERGIVHPNGKLDTKPYGMTEFAVLDPDNNLITFFQQAATAPGGTDG